MRLLILVLVFLFFLVFSLAGVVSASGNNYYLYIKWRDPFHLEEVSIVAAGSSYTDNQHGRYLVTSGGLDARGYRHSHSLRFDREARIPVDFIHGWISFRDTRLRDFDGSYERLWGLQGGAWSSSKGYCYWGYIVYGADGIHKVKLLKRIGRADAGAAFAVLSYHYPGPRPLSSYYSVRIEAGPPSGVRGYWRYATLISISLSDNEQHNDTIILCGGNDIEVRLLIDNAVKDTFVVHLAPAGMHPAASFPNENDKVLILGAGIAVFVVIVAVLIARR